MSRRKLLYITAYIVLLSIFLLSAFMIWREVSSREEDKEIFEELKQIVKSEEKTDIYEEYTKTDEKSADKLDKGSNKASNESRVNNEIEKVQAVEDQNTESEETPVPERNLSILLEQNRDCIGWVYIPNTELDYPVMHTPSDPEKYLRRNFYGKYSHSGVPFADGRCSMDSDNVLLYGHNMKNRTMFSLVDNYADQAYYELHPTLEFETSHGCKEYTIFVAAVVGASDMWYQFTDAKTQEAYDAMIDYIRSIALYDTGLIPEYGTQLITLSTCDYSQDESRFIIVAAENK